MVIRMDAFALGLIFIETGILKSLKGIYNVPQGKFEHEEFLKLKNEFNKNYEGSTLLLKIIDKLT